MKIYDPSITPFRDVDPELVVVDRLELDDRRGSWDAYGHVKETARPKLSTNMGSIQHFDLDESPPKTYRVAYQDELGRWCAEGTMKYEPPPLSIVAQISELTIKRLKQTALSDTLPTLEEE